MKFYILLSFFIMTLSCSKDNQQESQTELELGITKAEWYTSISDRGFGEVYLRIEGTSNAKLLTIETYGDGLLGCKEVQLDQNNNFSENLMIRFYPHWDTIPKKYKTYVTAYEYSESPDIVFCRTGTGKQIRKMLESDYMEFNEKK